MTPRSRLLLIKVMLRMPFQGARRRLGRSGRRLYPCHAPVSLGRLSLSDYGQGCQWRGRPTKAAGRTTARSGMHKEFRMVENIFEELDAPGEWFHNAKTGTLYYMPEAGVDLDKAMVEVVRLRHLIEFQGSIEAPVRFITLQGFVVRHAARTFMETEEPHAPFRLGHLSRRRGHAHRHRGCSDSRLRVRPGRRQRHLREQLQPPHAWSRGATSTMPGPAAFASSAIPGAVRDPLFEYGEKNDLDKIDRRPARKPTTTFARCRSRTA